MTAIGSASVSMDAVDECPGADQTFDDVLARYRAEIYRFAVQLTRNRDDADELYQRTLLEASRAFDRRDGTAPPRVWLYTIATDAFLSDRPTCGCEGPLAEERTAEITGVPPEQVAGGESGNVLLGMDDFAASLPCRQWVALVQRLYHGLSYAEIAATLRCSEAVARASVYEALRTLRVRFGDRL